MKTKYYISLYALFTASLMVHSPTTQAQSVNGLGTIIDNGWPGNRWLLHNPDDGRGTLFIAPGPNSAWNFGSQTQFRPGGDVTFSGKVLVGTNGNVSANSQLEVLGDLRVSAGRFSSIISGNSDGAYPTNPINTGGGAAQLSIGGNWVGGQIDLSFINSNIAPLSSGGKGFSFWQMTGANTKQSLMYVRGDGNVGIGNTAPGSKLHVSNGGVTIGSNVPNPPFTDGSLSIGDVSVDSNPTQQNWTQTMLLLNGLDYSTIGFHDSGSRVDFIRTGKRTIQLGYDGGWGAANIGLPNGIWDKDGRVGIGTSEPTQPLHVANGDALIAGVGNFSGVGTQARVFLGHPANWVGSVFGARTQLTGWNGVSIGTSPNGQYTERLVVDANGNVGIGNTAPGTVLDVNGNFRTTAGIFSSIYSGNTDGAYPANAINTPGGAGQLSIGANYIGGRLDLSLINSNIATGDKGFSFWQMTGAQSKLALMYIRGDGNVGIGTTNPGGYKLAVEGIVGAREVEVKTGAWADFVFANNYELPSLQSVEAHIVANKHLPGIPSEMEVKRDGYALGAMDAKLLQKIEELTLYVIEQQKRIEKLEQQLVKQKR
ncbi:hypothetical protein [Fibrella aquatilis]|uniref:Peptidase S74 domain-containing protein n=1 Tax=Fibrella aquatilis TaxID=2817059 RepID=A0A939K389_9BACT|nr:hypothetical protein [Fibrella aquatilis]MBO0934105.1 hypothetical protein [Fibrella aquatilis]